MWQAVMDDLSSSIVLGVVQPLLGSGQAGPSRACHQPDEEGGQKLYHRHRLDPADNNIMMQGVVIKLAPGQVQKGSAFECTIMQPVGAVQCEPGRPQPRLPEA